MTQIFNPLKSAIHTLPEKEARDALREMENIKREVSRLVIFEGTTVAYARQLSDEYDFYRKKLTSQTSETLVAKIKKILRGI